jgi:hypothetical protein
MSSKLIYCFNCDESFTLKWENTVVQPEFCPFCGEVNGLEESSVEEEEG